METLKALSFEALTMPRPASGYSVFLAASFQGNLEEVTSILTFSPSLLDTLIALKTPTLERAGLEFANKTPTDIVLELGTPSHQAIQEIFQQKTKAMENVSLIHLTARFGSVRHIRKLISIGVTLNNLSPYRRDEFSTPLCLAAGYNKTEVVEELICHGARLRKKDFKGFNAAHFAAIKGNAENLMCLLERDSQMKTTKFCCKANVLHLAARGGHAYTVEALLNIGLDIDEEVSYHWEIEDEDGIEPESDPPYSSFETDEQAEELRSFDLLSNGATPLMLAAKSGNIETAELLISKGAGIHAQDANSCSALFYACSGGHLIMMKFLIRNNLEVNCCNASSRTLLHVVTDVEIAKLLTSEHGLKLNAKDQREKMPLHSAVERGDVELVTYFLQSGADANAKDYYDGCPLTVALYQKHCKLEMVSLLINGGSLVDLDIIFSAAYNRFAEVCLTPEIVKLLIDASGKSVDAIICGKTFLHRACKSNLETTRFLVEYGADVNMQDDEGNLPLHVAAKEGNVDIAQFLLEQGSEVDVADDCGSTPLLVAAEHGNVEASKLLLMHSNNIYITNQNWDTALHIGARHGLVEVVQSLLNFETFEKQMSACCQMKDEFLQSLLLKRNILGRTALHEAVSRSINTETVEILLAHGSDVNAKDDSGRTALHVAAVYGHREIMKLLLKHGSEISAVDFENGTVLQFAVQSRNFETVSFAIGHCTCHTLNTANVKGNTPLHVALSTFCMEKMLLKLIHLFVTNGCNVVAANNWGSTALHLAAMKYFYRREDDKYPSLIKVLMEAGCESTAKDRQGKTALHFAARTSSRNCLDILECESSSTNDCQKLGKTPKSSSLYSRDAKGRTPLHETTFSYRSDHEGIISLLLDRGCDVEDRDVDGLTALHTAAGKWVNHR